MLRNIRKDKKAVNTLLRCEIFHLAIITILLLSVHVSAQNCDQEWNTLPCPVESTHGSVIWAENQFVSIGGNQVAISNDGVSWITVTLADIDSIGRIAYGGNTYLATQGNEVYVSENALIWQLSCLIDRPRGISYGGGKFIVATASGNIYTSRNGKQWHYHETPFKRELNAVTYGQNLIVAVGKWGAIATSRDGGRTWVKRRSGTSKDFNSVTYGPRGFVAVGNDGTIATSQNGKRWYVIDYMPYYFTSITYTGSEYIAVGSLNMTPVILSSLDGVNWSTLYSQSFSGVFNSCAASDSAVVVLGWTWTSTNKFNPVEMLSTCSPIW